MKFFETIKIVDGEIFNIEYHQKRYERTISYHNGVVHNLKKYINPPKDGLYRAKIIYDKNSILDISYFSYEKREIKSFKLVEIDFDYDFKYLDRANIDKAFAKRLDCDEIIMIKDNLITDTSIANIAFFDAKEWVTPKKPLLSGTTRERYIDNKLLHVKDIKKEQIQNFTKIALLNAMIDFDIISNIEIKKGKIIAN